MRKKIIIGLVMVLALIGSLGLAGCTKTDKTRVGVFIYDYADTYIGSVRDNLKKQLESFNDVEVEFFDGKKDQAEQNSQIDAKISKGVDIIVVNIVDMSSAQNVLNKAKTAEIPIVFFNREIDSAVINSYNLACYVGTDANEAGYMQGEMIANILLKPSNYEKYDLNGDGYINYAMLRAEVGNPEADGRTRYSVEKANTLLTAQGKNVLKQVGVNLIANWDAGLATTQLDALLSANPYNGENPIEMIIANNDDMAIGAITSLNKLGYNSGTNPEKYIPVFGVDATAVAQKAIADKKMSGSIKQDAPGMSTAIVKIANNLKTNKEFLADTNYKFENDVKKLRIPYQIYVG